jgi:hypothetical protein
MIRLIVRRKITTENGRDIRPGEVYETRYKTAADRLILTKAAELAVGIHTDWEGHEYTGPKETNT